MSKINFFALGGMDEIDKSCYVLEIDSNFYIFNLGISILSETKVGIKKIIPDVSWIDRNKQKIKGIFIGSPNKNNIGSIQYAYNWIKNIPIYTCEFGKDIIESYFNKRNMSKMDENFSLKFNVIKPLQNFNIDNISITPFRTSSYIPSSLGFILHTNDGDIVYIDDFFVNNDKTLAFVNDLFKVQSLLKKDVLLLITNLGNATKFNGFTAPNYKTKNFYLDLILKLRDSRLIIGLYDYDMLSFITLALIAKEKQIPFIIYNSIFMSVFNSMGTNDLLNHSGIPLLPIQKINELKKGIVIVSSSFDAFFNKISKITSGEDLILKLKTTDTFVLGTRTISGFEKYESETMDAFSLLNIDCYRLPKNFIEPKASSEDHKFLVRLLNPKYIIPTLGLYSDMVKYTNFMQETGFNENNVITLSNGEIFSIIDKEKSKEKKVKIEIYDKFVGQQGLLNEGNNILVERKVMAEHGIIFFSILLRQNTELNESNFDWKDVGVFPIDEENTNKIISIKQECNEYSISLLKESKSNFDNKEIKQIIKKFIVKIIEKNYSKLPIVIVSIV